MHIDPRRLPFLLAVHQEGGVVAAADVLHISASAVSQQLRHLEDEVGLTLVQRTGSGLVLTPAGLVLAQGAERITGEIDRMTTELRPLAGHVTGTVTIGAFATVTRALLLPALPHLREELPGVEVSLREVDEGPGMAALRSGRLDALVLEKDTDVSPTPRGWEDLPLLDEKWVVVSPESAPTVATLDDLARLRWLRVSAGMTGTEPLRRIQSRVGELEVVDFSYLTYEVALALVREGIGSTVLPAMALHRVDTTGIRLSAMAGLGVRRILLRRRRGSGDEDAAGQFVTRLRGHVARNGPNWDPQL
ncbi:LysR family transcriptional regulator [Schaalia sp. 19OD2882]|uniref:LysR family transcriptional regulator n=1 Tax=Schaalia sp. 19OD2882 TaxID=2794089 RepID=UPI001C1EACDF|nr:LysR family transcriptional regulator [Schaalia sp. 19OD2882]QWW20182.1 LysR family transcriptional regulator [Schaalia sp. 19OD2882]